MDNKVNRKVRESDQKRKPKKQRTKKVNISGKVHGKKKQGTVKYGTPLEEVHLEEQK